MHWYLLLLEWRRNGALDSQVDRSDAIFVFDTLRICKSWFLNTFHTFFHYKRMLNIANFKYKFKDIPISTYDFIHTFRLMIFIITFFKHLRALNAEFLSARADIKFIKYVTWDLKICISTYYVNFLALYVTLRNYLVTFKQAVSKKFWQVCKNLSKAVQ